MGVAGHSLSSTVPQCSSAAAVPVAFEQCVPQPSMALVAMCARAAVVTFMLVVMVSSSASARITAPTSDYNNLDTLDSADLVDAPSPSTPASSGEAVAAAPSSDEASSLLPWTVGAMRMLRRVYLECRDDDLSSCLKVQVVRAMDRVARSTRKVALGAGVTLERDADAPEPQQEQGSADDDLEHTLPRSLPERERSLDKLILEKLFGFLQNYSLRLKLPSVAELNGAVGAAGEDGECRQAGGNKNRVICFCKMYSIQAHRRVGTN